MKEEERKKLLLENMELECPRAAAQPPVPLRYENSGGVEGEPAG